MPSQSPPAPTSSMASNISITPAFSWAHPEPEAAKKLKESPKPVSNPLLRISPRVGTSVVGNHVSNGYHHVPNGDLRPPFSPLTGFSGNENGLRQRTKPVNGGKQLPPKVSLTEVFDGSQIGLEDTMDGSTYFSESYRYKSEVAPETDGYWILVFGLSSSSQHEEVLRRFESFGHVTAHRSGRSNWLALRYENSLEAEKALCQQPCVLSDGSLLGVSRLDNKLSITLDWEEAPTMNTKGARRKEKITAEADEDILLLQNATDRRQSSICGKFLAILFGWDDVN